ncbi:transmembrane protein [Plectosphaerella cucumerina]|uniref:Store-operated calcium entry-associated regulatory factor n=1 Tax=Plectosphaerella cucumerina TaxID=40658 RepID=A0A8K0TF29_9PEZI|nr:transmembrane protein [Plectosphaerella cucumerina]
MRSLSLLPALLLLSDLPSTTAKQPPKNAILLSQVQTLTLRGNGAKTTHRRLPAVPQLKCLSSPDLCRLHDIDVLRCTNQGSGYDDEDTQWSCTANLPPELKLGSTDVICEGYSSSEDPYVLKGSCGVEYRVALTKEGEKRYPDIARGRSSSSSWFGEDHDTRNKSNMSGILFAIVFVAVFAWIVYSACMAQNRNRRLGGGRRGGGGGGWGGGGGGGGPGGWQPWNNDDDPPPPYPGTKPSSWSRQSEGWRPGFWSGLATGGAGGYYAGRRSNRDTGYRARSARDNDAGPSGTSSWGSSSSGTATRESTGFGSTSRR